MANARKVKFPTPNKPQPPRLMPEIEQSHANLCARLGALEYQISIYQEDAKTLKDQLKALNHEAAARNELNKAAPVSKPEGQLTPEVANV